MTATDGGDPDHDDTATVNGDGGRPAFALVALVVVAGLAAGLVAALLLRSTGDDGPSDADVHVALSGRYVLTGATARCVLERLEGAGALDGDRRRQLVDEAGAGADPTAYVHAEPVVAGAIAGCLTAEADAVFAEAGVEPEVAACAAATIAEAGPLTVRAAVEAPLAEGSVARDAVQASTRDPLAEVGVEAAGIDDVDAQCVAGEVIDRLGLETVLSSLAGGAVPETVRQSVATAATTCATGG